MRTKTQILVQSLSPKQYKKLKLYLELEGANTYTFDIYAYFETNVIYEEEALKKKLFKYIPYTETHFRRMLSDFNKSIEAFIITQEALQDQETKELLLNRYYQKIDQPQLYSLPKTYHLESEAWHLNFKIGLQNAFRALKQKRNPNLDWQSLFEQLEQYYALQKSRLYLTVLSKNNLFEGTNSPQELEAWIIHLQTIQHPVLQIYTLALTLILKDDATAYTTFEAQILNSSLELHPEHQKEMLLVALNFCLKRLNRGEKVYGKKALQVYRKGFEQGYFKEGAYISHLTYRNAVALALKEEDLEWASWAIETYKNELLPHQQHTNYAYCKALLAYEQKNYQGVIRWLSQMDFEDDLLALNAKTVLLKAYYEKGELESLEYLLESFKSYIQRKNLQGFYKDYFLTLVKAVKKMIHCTRPSQLLKLKHDVESVSKMAAKEWLLEQLNQVLR